MENSNRLQNYAKRSLSILEKIHSININIKELRQKINKVTNHYKQSLASQRKQCLDELLKNYELPHIEQVILLSENIKCVNQAIQQKNEQLFNAEEDERKCQYALYDEISELMALEKESKQLNDKIKTLVLGTGIIKDKQLDLMLKTISHNPKFNKSSKDVGITLIKWQKRRQTLANNCKYISIKKKQREEMRLIDKRIKDIYWQIVLIEEYKNQAFREVTQQFQLERSHSNQNINPKLYKLDIAIGQLMSDTSYIKYKQELKHRIESIELQHDTAGLYKKLDMTLDQYINSIDNYNQIDVGNVDLPDIHQIYQKYRQIIDLIVDKNEIINKKQYVYEEAISTTKKINESLFKLMEKLKSYQTELADYEITHEKIIEDKLKVKLERRQLRMDNWKIEQEKKLINKLIILKIREMLRLEN